ncbi:MAG TPA: tRNA pseudouridine(55) synthase TruB [Actinomycetota bacterium]|nr:tRNA pseudouridine(55) synthase TruB [Actinomycetota bacterium]
MDGVLVIDKPSGVTSHDVVDEVRKRLSTKRVGHGGTLDPGATGVLLIGIGKATRFLSYAQAAPKRYAAVVRFGATTSTLDAAGEVLTSASTVDLTRADVERVLPRFVGNIEQVPPMVSAVKVGGERLYQKARRGEEVERSARSVTIHDLEVTSFTPGDPAEMTIDVRCSGGTYIRSLAGDIGEALGCGAHLSSLRRTEAGGFGLEEAIAPEEVTPERVKPLSEVVRDLPKVMVDEQAAALVANGRPLDPGDAGRGEVRAVMHGEDLLGVYRVEKGMLRAERVVPR